MIKQTEEIWTRFAKHNEEGNEEVAKYINSKTNEIRDMPPDEDEEEVQEDENDDLYKCDTQTQM